MLVSFAKKVGRFALLGWNKRLRPHEAAFIEDVLRSVDPHDRDALVTQLERRERLQRWNSDRMVLFGLGEKEALPRIADTSENHCLAKARLLAGGSSIVAVLMSHRGLLSSIEFSKAPSLLQGYEVEVKSLTLGDASKGYSASIEPEEHSTGEHNGA
jgi:hypothetical protein